MKAKIGRPKIDNPRNKRLEIRLTQDELDKINNASKAINRSRTDTILYGIDLIRNQKRKPSSDG